MPHSSLLKELQPLNIRKKTRFFKLIDKQEYSQAFLYACKSCEPNDKDHLKAIEILLSFRDKLHFDINGATSKKKNAFDVAWKNKNYELCVMLYLTGMRPYREEQDAPSEAEIQRLDRAYSSVHDAKDYNNLIEQFSNKDKLPNKIDFPNDDDNAKHDKARIEIILKAISYLQKLQLDYSNHHKLTTDQMEYVEYQALMEAKKLLLNISEQTFNLSKQLRERYEHYFLPAPFTWYTLEQLASMIVIPDEKLIYVSNFGAHFTPSKFAALFSFMQEVIHSMDIFDASIPEIINADLPSLKYFLTTIKVNLDNPATPIPVKPVCLPVTKAIVTHLTDTMSLYQLINMVYLVDNKRLPPEIIQRFSPTNQAPRQVISMDSNATRYGFDSKPGLFASLRRLQLLGELTTGKNFSKQLTDLDDSVDWQALIGIRDHTVHQDQSDFKKRVAAILAQPQLIQAIYNKDINELGDILVGLIVARHQKTGGFDVSAKMGAKMYCMRILAESNKHHEAIKMKLEAGKERCKMVVQLERRVSEEEERKFINFLTKHNTHCQKDETINDELMGKIIKIFHGEAGKANIISGKDTGMILKPITKLGRNTEEALELSAIWKKAINSYNTTEEQRTEQRRESTQLRQEREQAVIDKKKGIDNIRHLSKRLGTPTAPESCIDTQGHIDGAQEALTNIQECLQWVGIDPRDLMHKHIIRQQGAALVRLFEQFHLIRHAIEYNVLQFCLQFEKLHALKLVDETLFTPERAYAFRVVRNFLEHGIPLIQRWAHKPSTIKQQPHSEQVHQLAGLTVILLAYYVDEMRLVKTRWQKLKEEEQNPHYTQWFGRAEREPTQAEWGMFLISAREKHGLFAQPQSMDSGQEETPKNDARVE